MQNLIIFSDLKDRIAERKEMRAAQIQVTQRVLTKIKKSFLGKSAKTTRTRSD